MPDSLSTDASPAAVDVQAVWFRYRTVIIAALAVAILLIAGFAGFKFYRDKREADAARALAAAANPGDLQKVIAQYPDSAAAPSAYLLFAESEAKDKKFAEADTTLQTFVNKFPHHQMVSTAKMAMASNLQALGKIDESLAMYRQIASVHANEFNAPFALLAQARILQEKNQIEEARRACETVIMQYRDAEYPALEAQSILAALKPASAPTPSLPAVTPTAAAKAPSPAAKRP